MNVPFHLRRRPEGRPAVALLLLGRDVAGLLDHCARLGLDPTGRVFAVAGGLLLTLREPTTRPLPGAIRLRALAAHLFVPVDAALVPALLDDEAEGLTRRRGLVFLPDGRALAYDPLQPLPPMALLRSPESPGHDWRSLPDPPRLADRIEEIAVEWSPEVPDDVLDPGAGGAIGTEEPRPDDAGAGATLAGRATLGAGKGLVWLGETLGIKPLAALGARWVGAAMNLAPRLSEDVFGRQAAALRALLREFREGDVERALRRALPLGDPGGGRGTGIAGDDRLPAHPVRYSLEDLLGSSDRRPGSVWLGGQDVMAELIRAYRQAAEQAQARGDFRRAAYIHGKLLKDYRQAAHLLQRGGLHHDAAVLLLAKLNDPQAAARAFEAAGEFDRAVQLYRQTGQHEAAGDLLRRIGEEDAALAEYCRAADALLASGAGHLAAGRLLLTRAGRLDLAFPLFEEGWARRPDGTAVGCAVEAARLLAGANQRDALRTLIDEADRFFETPGQGPGVRLFYGEIAGLADSDAAPAGARDELRDRALLGLAAELRRLHAQGATSPQSVSMLLGEPGRWPAVVLHDAEAAVRARPPVVPAGAAPPPAPRYRFRVGVGIVTAVASASDSGAVFLGFEGGEVLAFLPERSEVVRVAAYDLPVTALATDPDGSFLIVLRSRGSKLGSLSTYARRPDGSYQILLGMTVDDVNAPWLTPVLPTPRDGLVGLFDGQGLYLIWVSSLTSAGVLDFPGLDAAPTAALLVPRVGRDEAPYGALLDAGRGWDVFAPRAATRGDSSFSWRPTLPEGNSLRSVPLSWAWEGERRHVQVVGMAVSGAIQYAVLGVLPDRVQLYAARVAVRAGGYRAATLVRPGLVAGVAPDRIDWLRAGDDRLAPVRATECELPAVVACFPCHRTGELVVICGDGFVARVPIPA